MFVLCFHVACFVLNYIFSRFMQVRMMRGKDDSRGYAFVNFRTKGLALKVVKELNNAKLKVCFLLNLKVDYHAIWYAMSILSLHQCHWDFILRLVIDQASSGHFYYTFCSFQMWTGREQNSDFTRILLCNKLSFFLIFFQSYCTYICSWLLLILT